VLHDTLLRAACEEAGRDLHSWRYQDEGNSPSLIHPFNSGDRRVKRSQGKHSATCNNQLLRHLVLPVDPLPSGTLSSFLPGVCQVLQLLGGGSHKRESLFTIGDFPTARYKYGSVVDVANNLVEGN